MAKNPIIFACANPDPEITPEEINEIRDDAIMSTGSLIKNWNGVEFFYNN